MDRQPSNERIALVFFLILILPLLWAAVLAAPFVSGGLISILTGLMGIENPFTLSWCSDTPKTMALFLLIYALGIGIYYATKRNTRKGEEHGSAQWTSASALRRKYADKDPYNNIILTQHVQMGLDSRKHKRNLNVMVVGGSGAGKTRNYVMPNILQKNTSFVIIDTKGEILRSTGHLLENDYEIRVLDLLHMEKSFGYNAFKYLHSEPDVLKLVANIIRNTTPRGSQASDPFWERAEQALMSALILYLLEAAPPYEQCFPMLMELIMIAEAREEDETYVSILDVLFERLADSNPNSLAVKQYSIFKLSAARTSKSILVSLGVRLEKLNLPQMFSLTSQDELDFRSIGLKKVALFALIPDNDSSLNFLIGMMFTQLFQELYRLADSECDGRLPVHVHVLADEFANIALPNEFDKILSTMRSREISISIILQNMAQLKSLYEKNWESLAGNCDEFLYLGSNELSTHEYVSKLIGKQTLDTNTYGRSKGHNAHYSTNWQITGRDLLTCKGVKSTSTLNIMRLGRLRHRRTNSTIRKEQKTGTIYPRL